MKVTGGCRKLHNEKPQNLYSSLNIRMIKSQSMRWAGHVACMGKDEKCIKNVGQKPEEKRQLGRPREDIYMDLKETG
jgi:hypothetical protein